MMIKYKNFLKKYNTVGIVFLYENKILLVQQNSRDNWSYPKGKQEDDETLKETAIREVNEEVGLNLDKNFLNGKKIKKVHRMKKSDGIKTYWYFEYKLTDIEYGNIFSELSKSQLQAEEITDAKFFTFNDALDKIDKRFLRIFNNMKILDIVN